MNAEATPPEEHNNAAGLTCGDSYRTGWKLITASFGILFAITLIGSIIRAPVDLQDDLNRIRLIPGWINLLIIAFSILVALPIGMSYSWIFLNVARGEDVAVKDLAAVFSRNYWPAVGAGFLKALIVIVGLILLVLPGLYLAARLAFVDYLVIDRRMGVRESFRTSWELTAKHQGTLFGMVLLAFVLFIAGFLVFVVGLLVAVMWVAAAFAVMYHRVDPHEGVPTPESESNPAGIVVLSTLFALFLLVGMFAFGQSRLSWEAPEKIPVSSTPVLFGEHYYQLFEEPEGIEWPDAKERCEEMGGYLVIINDAAENDFLTTMGAGNGAYYLGASDEAEEGDWRWVDGSPMTYQNWHANEPNNYGGPESYLISYHLLWPKWADGPSTVQGFICEWDAQPENVELEDPLPEDAEEAVEKE